MTTPSNSTPIQRKSPSRLTQQFALPLLCSALVFMPIVGTAQIINYVGSETGSPANGFSVQNWSNPGVAKTWDIGGTDVYGTAGYYQIRPTLQTSPSNVNEPVGAGNDLGILAVSNPTLFSLPSFLSSATGAAGTFVNFGGYADYRGPDGLTLYRNGALSVSVNQGPFNSPAGSDASYFGIAMSFTLNSTANFRLGLAVDSVGSGTFAPNYISIGGVFSDALTRDGSADMAFFDIQGTSGDTLNVALWQNTGTQSVAALSLVTYDVIPEPSAGLLALFGLASAGAFHALRKRRNSPGSSRQSCKD
jgi:hypothetical protein